MSRWQKFFPGRWIWPTAIFKTKTVGTLGEKHVVRNSGTYYTTYTTIFLLQGVLPCKIMSTRWAKKEFPTATCHGTEKLKCKLSCPRHFRLKQFPATHSASQLRVLPPGHHRQAEPRRDGGPLADKTTGFPVTEKPHSPDSLQCQKPRRQGIFSCFSWLQTPTKCT